MKQKPVVLLCWGYHRKGWVEVFEQLKEDFEFHYIFWISKDQEPAVHTDCPIHYWGDFRSASEILGTIKPEKVVLMGTDSLLVLSLVYECRQVGIPTYVMQHGLLHDLKTNIYLDRQIAKNKFAETKDQESYVTKPMNTLGFFIKSLRFKHIPDLFLIAKFHWDRRKYLHLEALARNRYHYKMADFYIVYTKFNGVYFTESEGVPESKMIEVGVPEFDSFFLRATSEGTTEQNPPYNLLVDSALTYIKELGSAGIVSQESYNEFIEMLNQQSLLQERKLYVKLHPYCYFNTAFPEHENIIYYRDADTVGLILHASAVIGFDSTLMLPALYFKPTILFTLHGESYLQKNIREMACAPVLDYFKCDDSLLQSAFEFVPHADSKVRLTERFLYKVDGRASERVKRVLQE